MLSFTVTSLLALSTLGMSAPTLQIRSIPSNSTPAICRPTFNSSETTSIHKASEDTRAAWQPSVNSSTVNATGTWPAIQITDLGTMDPDPTNAEWIIKLSDAARGTYTIAPSAAPDACAAATNTTGGKVEAVPCDDAEGRTQWFITCQTCGTYLTSSGGNMCEIQSAYQGQCVAPGNDTIYSASLADCDNRGQTTSEQYWSL
ncbi:hypothetical protein MNV49_002600 [Pseudohyphozyma bogoriensis]|nr:hypothetical protein MNV49_002600 [Pseudohyphozyma bogoriensis]